MKTTQPLLSALLVLGVACARDAREAATPAQSSAPSAPTASSVQATSDVMQPTAAAMPTASPGSATPVAGASAAEPQATMKPTAPATQAQPRPMDGAPAAVSSADAATRADAALTGADAGPDAGSNDSVLVKPNAQRGNALSDAYAALTRGEKTNLSSIVAAIDRQAAANPDDAYAVFYAGAFRLWQLSESLDLTAAPGMLDNLERARELLPNDFRVTGFYGLSQVVVGGFGDPALLEKGLETLSQGIEQESMYGHFLRAAAVSTLSSTHPAFQTALADMQTVEQNCKVQKDAGGTYHYPTDKDPSRPRVCTNDGIVPHAWEGFFANFGDIALKSGASAEQARAVYRSAMTAPTYAEWPFKRALEQRIERAEENYAAWADGNALNDPSPWSLGGSICVGCHQKQ